MATIDLLEETVRKAVHFLDNVIDVNNYPLEKISEMTRSTRKIGLGVMGFADALLALDIPYDSAEGTAFAEELMSFIEETGRAASRELAKTRGAFPLFSLSTLKDDEPIRNATVTTIAPTNPSRLSPTGIPIIWPAMRVPLNMNSMTDAV